MSRRRKRLVAGSTRRDPRTRSEWKPPISRRPTTSTRLLTASGPVRRIPPFPNTSGLIAAGRYSDAYMINWRSNVFPGVLGRTCDRPCEPACRRGRVEKEPVAICRLKRVAADFKDDIQRPPAAQGDPEERPAHRPGRRRPRLAHGGARSRAARLSLRGVRCRPQGGRHDPHPDSAFPLAGIGDRRGMRLHPRPRHRFPPRHRASTASRRCSPRTGTPSLSAPARRAGATSTFRAATKRQRTSTSASTGCPACRSAISRRSANVSSCSAAATPPWTAAARRADSAARRSPSWCAPASRR